MNNGTDSTRLIEYALRRLLPDVFFHPIWAHVIETDGLSPEQIQPLLDSVDQLLSAGKLHDACEALFVCAFQQMRAGDYTATSGCIHRIRLLAEQHELPQVAWWAAWGAAAVCTRQGLFRQATEHLEHLRSLLGQQHEWVLSDVIEMLRQDLLSQAEAAPADHPQMSDAALSSALDQLLQWGAPQAVNAINANGVTGRDGPTGYAISSSGTAGFSWRAFWQKIKRIVKGELRLRWVEANTFAPLLHGAGRNALMLISPVNVTALAPAPVPPSLVEPATSTREQEPAAAPSLLPEQANVAADLSVPPTIMARLLGTFGFSVNDTTVQNWPTGKGRAVFKYMLAHHDQPIPRDVLMDAFWPQAGPDAARNSLNVALHGLRQALKTVTDMPVVLFEDGAYCLNPEFNVWVDVDVFDRHVQSGRRLEANGQVTKAAAEYEAAIGLYQGDFLAGDLYEEWPVLPRERLRVAYMDVLDHLSQIRFSQGQYADCVTLCQLLLTRDTCREDIHCLLMRCYSREGQGHLALRQYQICVEALRAELEVDPAPETTRLYEQIRRRGRV